MKINCVTLAVDDLDQSFVFYTKGLGLADECITKGEDHLAIELPAGLYLVLILRSGFSEFTVTAAQQEAPKGASECILSYFASSKEEVDNILERCVISGGSQPAAPETHPWGYAGFVKDPDSHLWEIMWNPDLKTD